MTRTRHIPPPTPPVIAAVLSEHDSESVLITALVVEVLLTSVQIHISVIGTTGAGSTLLLIVVGGIPVLVVGVGSGVELMKTVVVTVKVVVAIMLVVRVTCSTELMRTVVVTVTVVVAVVQEGRLLIISIED